MNVYPCINLPDYFTCLLKMNMQGTTSTFHNLVTYVYENDALNSLVQSSFLDIDSKGQMDNILKSMGWIGFRNRLALLFISYAREGSYPESFKERYIDNLIEIENRLGGYTVEGYSRAFLFAFYLEMCRISLESDVAESETNHLQITKEIVDLLSYSKERIVKIDWVLLMLIHFETFFGKKKLHCFIADGMRYEDIYHMLEQDQKEIMMGNLLSYSSSINEHDMFVKETV